jgi:hypothetical protein
VKQPDGLNLEAEQVQLHFRVDLMRDQGGHEGVVDVSLPLEDVLIDPPQVVEGVRLGVDVDRCLHRDVESADFIQAKGVINMVMGEQDRITAINSRSKYLLTKIRRGIDQDGPWLVLSINESDGGRGP